jgi:hypothetical protein
MLRIMRGCGSRHQSMAHLKVAYGGDGLQMLKVAANVVIKQWRAANKGWSSSLGVGLGKQPITFEN